MAGALEELLNTAQIGYGLKERIAEAVARDGAGALASIATFGTLPSPLTQEVEAYDQASPELVAAVAELLLADGPAAG
ncbi:hypothetical protein [Brachybacterium huguangmaarense]